MIFAVVLAAGRGTRIHSQRDPLPKVMRPILGRPMISYVLDALSFVNETIVVVGYRQEAVRAALGDTVRYAEQLEQKGTGHAVLCTAALLEGFDGPVLICCGDMPLIRRETYQKLLAWHTEKGNACTLLSGTSDRDLPYGRVQRDEAGAFGCIIEETDCTPEQMAIAELNAGVYVMSAAALFPALRALRPDNAQGELYLTDVPALLKQKGLRVDVCRSEYPDEIIGVNTPEDLARAEAMFAMRNV